VCSRAPIRTKHNREGLVSLQKIRLNLQASVYTPFEARGLLSGTVIRGTPNTLKHSWKTSSRQTVKAGKHDAKLKPHLPRDAISSRPSPAAGKNRSPRRIHASPEGPPSGSGCTPGSSEAKLGQTLSCSNLGQIALPPTVSHAHSMQGSRDTLSLHARLSWQGRSDRSHFAPLLIVLTGKQHYSPCSDYYANHQGKTNNSKSRPLPSSASGATGSSASPDPRPRPLPRPQEEVSASPDPRSRPQPRPWEESQPRPTSASASGGVTASPDLGFGPTTLQGIHHYPTSS
jgi:hypothetical protein